MTAQTVILNFHGIGMPHDGLPADELPYWIPEARFEAVIQRLAAMRQQGRLVDVTFDDGNKSDLDLAVPILLNAGLKADFYILTGRLSDTRYLSADNIRTLIESGMGIGLHGQDHKDWRQLGQSELHQETGDARQVLASVAGYPIDKVSIPFGAYNARLIRYLKAAGFAAIMTSDGGTTSKTSTIQARTSIRSDMSDRDIENILSGNQSILAALRRKASCFVRRYVI